MTLDVLKMIRTRLKAELILSNQSELRLLALLMAEDDSTVSLITHLYCV